MRSKTFARKFLDAIDPSYIPPHKDSWEATEMRRLADENNRLHRVIHELNRDMNGTVRQLDEYRSALKDISRLPEGDEQSAQAVACEVLGIWSK
jgi:hypothetical protein